MQEAEARAASEMNIYLMYLFIPDLF